ncbi:MAG: major facilitator superfamily domain-containing protein [Benjaminiella poitrasii]|nr:MAG: major facilitator superfamily domain-containing protein [Benjaminiella poitrasii]
MLTNLPFFYLFIHSLYIGSFLAAVDTSIITTIFNEIGTEFKNSNLAVWIMTSYTLSASAAQPLYGKLSDVFGRKSALVVIVCFFLVGSWFCGLARTMVQMGVARAIAGLGGGGIMTMASVIIHGLVPIRQRGQYQSNMVNVYTNIYICVKKVGTTVGTPLGGLINDMLGWRYCFYINILFCLFILHAYLYKMKDYNISSAVQTRVEEDDHQPTSLFQHIDFIGTLSLGGNTHAWTDSLIVSLIVLAVFFFGLFSVFELNGWTSKNPLISPRLIRNRNVVAVCLNNYFLCSSTMTLNYPIPQFFMGVLGYSPSSAGLWVLPRTVMVAIGCWIAGHYLRLKGRYKHFLNAVMVLHMLTALGHASWTPATSMVFKLACMSPDGFIFGIVFVITMVALVADDVDRSDTASATSMIFLCRSMGWLSGSTMTAAILQGSFKQILEGDITTVVKDPREVTRIIEFVRTCITKVQTLASEV